MARPGDGESAAKGPRRGPWRTLAAAGGALLLAYAAARVAVTLPPVHRLIRDRVVAALRPRLGDVTLGRDVEVDGLLHVTFGPLSVPGATRSRALLRAERVRVRPSVSALLRGRLEPASIRLDGVRLAIGPRARDLRAFLDREEPRSARGAAPGSAAASRTAPGLPAVRLRDLVVVVPIREREVEIGPLAADVRARRDGAATELEARVRLQGGGRLDLEARSDGARWRGHVRLADVGPGDVPEALRDLPAALAGGTLAADVDLDAAADLARARAKLRVVADRVYVAGAVVSDAPLGPFRASMEGELSWDAATRRATFRDGAASVGDALRVDVEGDVRAGPGLPYALSVRASDVDWAAAIAALPPALRPPDGAPRARGTFDARLDASGPLLAPSAWTIDAALELSRMRAASRGDPEAPLRRPFTYEPEADAGEARPFEVGPRNPLFVPVAELPAYVIRAVTASEDAGFFAHHGFDFAELANAFSEGAELGRVVRGGSTITQQLAKNLYLSREKTIARKVREAAITVALEATVPKTRLLEIYLNVAEWGPGVYGIGAAARHWFGKDARALSPKEAAFLASIIPNPVRYHYMRARGAVSDGWERRIDDLLLRMSEQGTLSPDELLRALAEPIVFANTEASAPRRRGRAGDLDQHG